MSSALARIAGAALLMSGPAAAETGAPLTRIGGLELTGTWTGENDFSAALLVGDFLLVGSDEIASIQVGRRVADAADSFAGVPPGIVLDPAGGEPDIEAMARVGNVIFAAGSHSATRPSADGKQWKRNHERLRRFERHPERDRVFRFEIDPATGAATGAVAAVSLRPVIDGDPVLSRFASIPGKENGIDIEGLAADGARLYAGLRGPVLRHNLVPVIAFRFDRPLDYELLFVNLAGDGIHELVKVSDGFLVLSGPAGDASGDRHLSWWNGKDCVAGKGGPGGVVTRLGRVPRPPGGRGRAEGLALLAESAQAYDILVVHDGVERGAPAKYRVARPAPSPRGP